MTTAAPATVNEAEVFRHQARMIQAVIRMNVEGVTQEESLLQPSPGGNCLNWVVGHLLCIYNNVLPLVGQERVMEEAALKRYDPGAAPIREAGEALELRDLLTAFDKATERFDAGLAGLSPEVWTGRRRSAPATTRTKPSARS